MRQLLYSLSIGLRIGAAMHLLHTNIFEFSPTGGLSMLPTIRALGDHVFVDKLRHRRGKNIDVGDVVICSKPTSENTRICKRVAGMPGDIVYANAMPRYSATTLDDMPYEAFVSQENPRAGKYIRVPEGHVWLLGDNATASLDSRDYGPVPMALIIGEVPFASFWGPWDFWPSMPRQIGSNVRSSSSSMEEYLRKVDNLFAF